MPGPRINKLGLGPAYSWDGLQEELENVQNRAARFVTGNYVCI